MKKALLIGIDYTSIPEVALKGCVDDVINIRNMLIDAYNYDPDNIIMLRDDPAADPLHLPTGENILTNIRMIVEESSQLDEIWIQYSGHGSQIPDPGSIKHQGIDDIIIPIDFKTYGPIRDIQLFMFIKEIKCRALIIFDCCHSGTICNLQWAFEYLSPTQYTRKMVDDVVIENPNIFMFSGCKDDQESSDTYNILLKQSVGAFTNAFIECLRKYHHTIDIMLLYREICRYLEIRGYTQRPVFSSSSMNPSYELHRENDAVIATDTIFHHITEILKTIPFDLVE